MDEHDLVRTSDGIEDANDFLHSLQHLASKPFDPSDQDTYRLCNPSTRDDDFRLPRSQDRSRTESTMADRVTSLDSRNMEDRSAPRSRERIHEQITTPSKTNIDCPWWQASIDMHLPRTCKNPFLENMSAVRRHATRGRKSHIPFLRQCRTCRKIFCDRQAFESQHGNEGELCTERAVTDNSQTQWKQFYTIACEELDTLKSSRRSLKLPRQSHALPVDSLGRELPATLRLEQQEQSQIQSLPQAHIEATPTVRDLLPLSDHNDAGNMLLAQPQESSHWADPSSRKIPSHPRIGFSTRFLPWSRNEPWVSYRTRRSLHRRTSFSEDTVDRASSTSSVAAGAAITAELDPHSTTAPATHSGVGSPPTVSPPSSPVADRQPDDLTVSPRTSHIGHYINASAFVAQPALHPEAMITSRNSLVPHIPGSLLQQPHATSTTRETPAVPDPIDCKICGLHFTGMYRRGNVARHVRHKHLGEQYYTYTCEEPGCGKEYRRQDARLKHYRRCHPQIASPPVIRRLPY